MDSTVRPQSAVPGRPEQSHGEWSSRAQWLLIATSMCLISVLFILVALQVSSIWYWGEPVVAALVCGIATLFGAASAKRKGLAWVLWGPAVLAFLAPITSWELAYVLALVEAVLFAGGWLVVRGRVGLSFLAMIVAPPLAFGILLVLEKARVPEFLADARTEWAILGGSIAAAWIGVALAPAAQRLAHRRAARRPPPLDQLAFGTVPAVNGAPAAAVTNPFAIVSLVLGIVGGSVLAVVFGHIARSQIKRTGQAGAGMALAGLILGYVWIAVVIAWLVFVLILASQLQY